MNARYNLTLFQVGAVGGTFYYADKYLVSGTNKVSLFWAPNRGREFMKTPGLKPKCK